MRSILITCTLLLAAGACWGQQAATPPPAKLAPGQDLQAPDRIERGWFYFEDNKKNEEEAPEEAQKPAPAPPPVSKKPPEERCKKAQNWDKDCGFVDPGNDFEFQAKQRDALLVGMSMSKNDPKAVEQFQYYMRWVMGRASEVSNLWAFNMAQNSELDPQAKQPISTFGIRMMTDVQHGRETEINKVIQDEGGMLVFFTKSDCAFCHAMVPGMLRVSKDTGIPVRNAALDGQCMAAFKEGCLSGEATLAPAQALQVATVPSVFLYVKPNTWIRVATGITDDVTLRSRIFSFFSAYRTAMLKGVNNAQKGRPSVDFSFEQDISGGAKGVDSPEKKEVALPTEADVARMLGKQ
jgi:hypothetical protein